jgi:hypothetical protein
MHEIHTEIVTGGSRRPCRFFAGLLVGDAKASLDRGTRAGFIAMNQALKLRAETASPP